MDTINRAYKKLTNANGIIRVFSIIALVIALIGSLLEPLGKLIYNMIFSNKIDYLLVKTFKSYIVSSQYSLLFLVMSVVLMVAAFSSKRKKNIGQGFGSLYVLVPVVVSIAPFIDMLDYFKSGAHKYYSNGADNLKFRDLCIILVYILPLCAAVLFLLCGLMLVVKASGEKPTEVTYVPVKVKQKPVQQGFAPQNQFNQNMNQGFGQPQGFNNNNNTMGGFGTAPFGALSGNTQSPFARPQDTAVPASAPLMDEVNTFMPKPEKNDADTFAPITEKTEQPAAGLPKVCPECGTVLAENAKFCKGCGKPV